MGLLILGLALTTLLGLVGCTVFAAAETMVICADRQRVRERADQGERSARWAASLLGDSRSAVLVTLMGSIASLVVAATAGAYPYHNLGQPGPRAAA